MVKFQTERIAQVRGEIENLLVLHWGEVALNQETIKLKPNWEGYEVLERKEMLHILTARDDKRLVGYHITIIQRHLHYVDSLTASSDIYFLLPPYRTGRTALRLFSEQEAAMKELGVQRLITAHKLHVNNIGELLEVMGFKHTENVYTKLLGGK